MWWLCPRWRGPWENVRQVIPRQRFFFFFEVEISSRTLISLFMPGSVHSGSVSWDDCGRIFPDKLRVSSFPDRFPHFAWTAAWSAQSDFTGSGVYVCLGGTCHLHLAVWSGSFTCHFGNTGVERTPDKSQHTRLTQEKKTLPLLLPGFELATFRSRVRRSYQQVIPVPMYTCTVAITSNEWLIFVLLGFHKQRLLFC